MRAGPAVEMAIRDDGRGFDVAATLAGDLGSRLGLEGMVERAGSAGGALEIRSTAGTGTVVRVRFPRGAELFSAWIVLASANSAKERGR